MSSASPFPRPAQRGEAASHVVDGGGIVDLSGEPLLGGIIEDRAADGKAFYNGHAGAGAESGLELVLGRFQAEEHDAPAPGVILRDGVVDRFPGRGRWLR